MKDLTDFAVIARSASTKLSNLGEAVLRVVPLANAPTLTEALGGLLSAGNPTFDPNQNMTLELNGSISKSNIHSVQNRSNGYVRVVARINGRTLPEGVTPQKDYPESLTNALGFALLKGIVEGVDENAPVKGWEVLAVASLKAGCDVTNGCYVAFTFSKTNNYQSVSFSPNAFATIEDLDKINGLDGLHIAFDTASGDLKLLDKDGNVLDQANLHMDADTIIADGEEGYKYVKTDRQQDIHAEKDFMPAGKTAGTDVPGKQYEVKNACFLVEVDGNYGHYQDALAGAQNALARAQNALADAEAAEPQDPAAVEFAQATVESAQAAVNFLTGEAIRKGNDAAVKGIRVYTGDGNSRTHADYALSVGGTYHLITDASGANSGNFLAVQSNGISAATEKSLIEVYSPDAFVWTVGKNVGDGSNDTFAEQMNAASKSMGFHVGDDIPLGTNISALLSTMSKGNATSPATGFDAEKYMHEGTDSDYIDELVDAQRNLAKEELKEWNKQHPALAKDPHSGTRISASGLDVRNGKIEIGNGIGNDGEDNVKRYVIETDIDKGARTDKGLQISVVGDGEGATYSDVQKDILTINAEDYISGAPTCLALLKCHKNPKGLTADLTETHDGELVPVNVGRITANFTASGAEANGVFTLTITDNRANNGFGGAPRIVEIIPVYKSGADATEAVPAQRSISAIKEPNKETGGKTLSIPCSQVIDWAQSIDLDPVNSDGKPVPNGMELYLIVKVY